MAVIRQDQDEETWLSRNIKMTPKYKRFENFIEILRQISVPVLNIKKKHALGFSINIETYFQKPPLFC